jgi:glycosyltransferase involved in cell wall biosynthesis
MYNKAPVSVVIPCYNCELTITKAIESVINQTVCPAEIILIDDVSQDNSCLVIESLIDKYSNHCIVLIKLIKNSGPGVARNKGWELATQPWIAFLDADDIFHPKKIEIQLDFLNQNSDVSMCGHNSELFKGKFSDAVSMRNNIKQISLVGMLLSNRFPTRSVMLKKNIPLKFYGKDVAEDYLLWLEIILMNYKCVKINMTLAYSLRPEFSSGGYSGQLWSHEKRELKAFKILFRKNKISMMYYTFFSAFSMLKFCRRVALTKFFIRK